MHKRTGLCRDAKGWKKRKRREWIQQTQRRETNRSPKKRSRLSYTPFSKAARENLGNIEKLPVLLTLEGRSGGGSVRSRSGVIATKAALLLRGVWERGETKCELAEG